MLERIYDTLRAILYYELPQDKNGNVVIYDRRVTAWYVGERDIKNTNLSVTFKGGSSSLKDIALGTQEYTHNIVIEIDAGADNIDISERLVQEATRIFISVLRKHRRIWIVEICPICEKFTISPEHFTLDHNNILSTYVTGVVNDYNNLWAEVHPASIAPATLTDSAKATEAFLRMYEDVRNNVAVANLSVAAKKNIQRMQADYLEPIRILYDVVYNDVKSSDDAVGRALQKSGTITITAKELVKQQFYGPDNVPTNAIRYNL